jgi:hypothetical protein
MFRDWLSATQEESQTPHLRADQPTADLSSEIDAGTESAESTAREKNGPRERKTASEGPIEVNSSTLKSLLFQDALAEKPLRRDGFYRQ